MHDGGSVARIVDCGQVDETVGCDAELQRVWCGEHAGEASETPGGVGADPALAAGQRDLDDERGTPHGIERLLDLAVTAEPVDSTSPVSVTWELRPDDSLEGRTEMKPFKFAP